MVKQLKEVAFLLSTAFLAGVWGCATTDSNPVIDVQALTVQPREVGASLELTGVLVPAQSVNLSSRTGGQVNALSVEVGSRVKEGDTLLQLDTEILGAQLQVARAGLESAKAATQLAINQSELANIELETAQKDFDTTNRLFSVGAVTRNQQDTATDRLNITRKRYITAAGPGLGQARAAILLEGGKRCIFVVKDEIAARRYVVIGLKTDDGDEIVRGLEAGEQVAVTNVNALTDQVPVRMH